MRAAARFLGLAGLAAALVACDPEPKPPSNTAEATEIEALPPDESVEAPPDEITNAPAKTDAADN